jgi:hypothetical protein
MTFKKAAVSFIAIIAILGMLSTILLPIFFGA